MKIAALETFVLEFPFRSPFLIAGGVAGHPGQPSARVFVRLQSEDGAVGWGEATPTPRWTYETTETIVSTLSRYLAPAVLGIELWDFDALHRAMDRAISPGVTTGSPLAKSAIDIAAHDALGKRLGLPVYQLLGGCRRTQFDLSWMISVSEPAGAEKLAREGLEAGYEVFDVKVGMHGEAGDLELVRATRKVVGERTIQVDANRGYRLAAARRQAERFAEFGVTLFEQPLDGFNLSGYRTLASASPVEIGIDESLRSVADLIEYARADAIHVAVAKLQRNSGFHRSRQLCETAQAAGLGLSLSGLTETDLGLAAGLHLAAAFDIDPLQLNGPQYIETPFLSQRVWKGGGRVELPAGPGLGVEVDEAWVRKKAVRVNLE
jgi:muconate cycloisomerase